jgi:hypothetical protein
MNDGCQGTAKFDRVYGQLKKIRRHKNERKVQYANPKHHPV